MKHVDQFNTTFGFVPIVGNMLYCIGKL